MPTNSERYYGRSKAAAAQPNSTALAQAAAARRDAAKRALRRGIARARESLPVYYAWSRQWPLPWHTLDVLNTLGDVIAQPDARAIITMPPRVGKSEGVMSAIEWALGNGVLDGGPIRHAAILSHTEGLAGRFSATIRDNFGGNARTQAVFPTVTLRTSKEPESGWNFAGFPRHKPNLRASGVDGNVVGLGFDLIVIDDPYKSPQDANSPTIREKVWQWFENVPLTRQAPGCRIVVVSTRWHVGDLSGRLLQTGGWAHTHLRMLDAANADRRARWWKRVGGGAPDPWAGSTALVPEFGPGHPGYSDAWCEAQQRAVGPIAWAAQYQGEPTVPEGELIKRRWLLDSLYDGNPPDMRVVVTVYDCADKPGPDSDFTAWVRAGIDANGQIWVLDMGRAQLEQPERVALVEAGRPAWRAIGQAVRASLPGEVAVVEDTLGGSSVIQQVRRNGRRPVTPVKPGPGMSKEFRALEAIPLIAAGGVRLPSRHPMLAEFIAELVAFPRGEHDDMFDAYVWAILYLSRLSRHVEATTGAARADVAAATPYAGLF